MFKTIYIEKSDYEELLIAAKRENQDAMLAIKGAVLQILDLWFPREEELQKQNTWETFLEHVKSDYKNKSTIVRDDVTISFMGSEKIIFEIENLEEEIWTGMEQSFKKIMKFYSQCEWKGKMGNFLPDVQNAVRRVVNSTEKNIMPQCLQEAIFAYAAKNPDKAALETLDADGSWRTITYSELRKKALMVSNMIRQQGVRKEDRVAIVLPKGFEQIIAVLGIISIGAIYVPVGIHQPFERKKKIAEKGNIKFFLTDRNQENEIKQMDGVQSICIEDCENFTALDLSEMNTDASLIAYIIFTSGTTGVPKGVMITHKAAWNTIQDMNDRFEVSENDCGIGISELDFDLSVYDNFGILGKGGTLLVLNENNKREPASWLKMMQERNVTLWNSVPALYEMFLLIARTDEKLKTLRCVFLSGDWIKLELYSATKKRFPDCKFVSLGGATEAAIWSVYYIVERFHKSWKSIPYGKPLANQMLRIRNAANQDCPDGVPGELWIGGDGVAEGYINEEELTQEKFIEEDGIRWYKTGDRVRYTSDGNTEFLGRMDDQIKLNGYRIELGEIENVIKKQQNVDDAIALIAEQNGRRKIVAAVVPKINQESTSLTMNIKEQSEEYQIEQNQRKEIVGKFILNVCDIQNAILKREEAERIPVYWRDWLKGNDILTITESGEAVTNVSEKKVQQNDLYRTLNDKVSMIQSIVSGNMAASILLEDEVFAPEVLLLQGPDTQKFIEDAANEIKADGNTKVAVLNCRTGAVVEKLLNQEIGKKVSLTLFDDSLGMLDKAKDRLKNKNIEIAYYHFEHGFLPQKYFQQFDYVIAAGVLHQYKEPNSGIHTALQLLKQSGQLLALEYEELDPMAMISSAILEEGFQGFARKRKHTSLLLMEEWKDILEHSGFHHVAIEKYPTSSALFIKAQNQSNITDYVKEDLQEYLERTLVHYMQPQEILCFTEFPLTGNGKVDRKTIRKIAERKSSSVKKDVSYIGIEAEIAKIWCKVLSLDEVGRNEGFFEIGGDSLLATKFIDMVKRQYSVELSLREMFDCSNLEKLSRIMEQKIAEEKMIEGEI